MEHIDVSNQSLAAQEAEIYRFVIRTTDLKDPVCCFWSIISPIPNFIKIGQKTQKLKIFAIGRFWLVGLVGQKMVVGISNSFYVVFGPLLAPIPNFIQIGQKTQKLKIFAIGRFWLVGLVGQKMVVGISNSLYIASSPILAPIGPYHI